MMTYLLSAVDYFDINIHIHISFHTIVHTCIITYIHILITIVHEFCYFTILFTIFKETVSEKLLLRVCPSLSYPLL